MLQVLRDDLAEHHLLGKIFGADQDRLLLRPARRRN
jgi:hypothetical protein